LEKILSYFGLILVVFVPLVGSQVAFVYQSFVLLFYGTFTLYFISGLVLAHRKDGRNFLFFLVIPKVALDTTSFVINQELFPLVFPTMSLTSFAAVGLGFWIGTREGIKSKLLPLFIGLLVMVVGFLGGVFSVYKDSSIRYEENQAFDYRLVDLSNTPVTSESLLGKVVLLDFWSYTCGRCFEMFPDIEELHQYFANDSDVVILSVHIGEEPLDKVAKHPRLSRFTFGKLHDPDRQLADQLEIIAVPQTFLFDKKGNLVKRHIGYSLFDDGIFFTWDWKRSIRALQKQSEI
jgi:thiol-disulfide isomerase/thioredoxin